MSERTHPKQLRHPASGGYARGSETRRRIMDSAIELFGEMGFEGASTRHIAKSAGVNPPALQYYFGNKEGLYVACAEYLVTENKAWLEPFLAKMAARECADADACIETVYLLLEAIMDHILSRKITSGQRLFYARMQLGQGPSGAAESFSNKLFSRLHTVVVGLVAQVCHASVEDELIQFRAMSLLGQVTMFHTLRRMMFPGSRQDTALSPDKIILMKSCLREQCQTLMRNWHALAEK
ncbi:CerR family C-terminal domain-containing protein [Martelella alba]|uniref:DUF1956 domain-containing protein n=1 Tax=Martelella alba TaxID=2590451 RepID=A0ABY2SG17_9HYPH|nr:CerR family C-terminal domain-containing protein [Martelella alba]TKI03357.1 DUF1956 domain-containing protein [Martelella alba]